MPMNSSAQEKSTTRHLLYISRRSQKQSPTRKSSRTRTRRQSQKTRQTRTHSKFSINNTIPNQRGYRYKNTIDEKFQEELSKVYTTLNNKKKTCTTKRVSTCKSSFCW